MVADAEDFVVVREACQQFADVVDQRRIGDAEMRFKRKLGQPGEKPPHLNDIRDRDHTHFLQGTSSVNCPQGGSRPIPGRADPHSPRAPVVVSVSC